MRRAPQGRRSEAEADCVGGPSRSTIVSWPRPPRGAGGERGRGGCWLHNCVTLSGNQCSGRAHRRFCKNCRANWIPSRDTRRTRRATARARQPQRDFAYLYARGIAFISRVHPRFCGRPCVTPFNTFSPSFSFCHASCHPLLACCSTSLRFLLKASLASLPLGAAALSGVFVRESLSANVSGASGDVWCGGWKKVEGMWYS